MIRHRSLGEARPVVLLIDCDPDHADAAAVRWCGQVEMRTVSDTETALTELRTRPHDGVLLRCGSRDESKALDVLQRIRALDSRIPVVLVAAPQSTDLIFQAGRLGATDLVTSTTPPAATVEQLATAFTPGAAERRQALARKEAAPWEFIGDCSATRTLLKDALTVAQVDSSVLITGEHGTGKEILARFIHRHSPRCNEPFVPVNCAGIPEGLFESELFGHEKGAFTGAGAIHRGSFELAGKGTILLDEITEMPFGLQAKLLRALQSGEYSRIGSERTQWAEARVICSTNRDPLKAVADHRLREDLYYRINVVHLHIPPLRERRDDVSAQARHFVEAKCRELGKKLVGLSPEAEALLTAHDWPGNTRELENLIERAIVFCKGPVIGPELLTPIAEGAAFLALPWEEARDLAMRRFERSYLTALLQVYSGSVSRASRVMGVSRQAFYKALERTGVTARPFRRRRTH